MKQRLIAMTKSLELVEYQGKTRMKNLIIASCSFSDSAENANGFAFQMQLQEAQFAVARAVRIAAGAASKSSSVKNTGLKTTSTKTVSATSYLSSVNNAMSKAKNTSIASARSTVADSGYGG